jgi:hypothetical protein
VLLTWLLFLFTHFHFTFLILEIIMQVYLQDMGTGSKNPVNVGSDPTVSDAFAAADIVVSKDIAVYINRGPADLSTRLSPGDVIQYQNTALKGATEQSMEELRQLTFEDVVSSGSREVPTDDSIWSQIFAGRLENSRKAMLSVSTDILSGLERHVSNVNAEVADLEKRLADAKDRQARARYATHQFTTQNNIFAPLAVMGQKDMAACYCNQIGVAVPDKNSPLWHTSATDGK